MTSPTLPNLLVAGFPKAGSTSLFGTLAQHPDVGVPAIKELHHFTPLRFGRPAGSVEAYAAAFARCGDRPVRLDATPGYAYGGERVASAVRELLPDARILMIMRDPVVRTASYLDWQRSRLGLPGDLTLEAYVDQCLARGPDLLDDESALPWWGLVGGRYADVLPPWIDRFGDRLRMVFLEDLVADESAIDELQRWIGLRPTGVALTKDNATTSARSTTAHRVALAAAHGLRASLAEHPAIRDRLRRAYGRLNHEGPAPRSAIDPGVRDRLEAYFADPNARLGTLVDASSAPRPSWLRAETT